MKKLIPIMSILVILSSCVSNNAMGEYYAPDPESLNFDGLQFGLCHAGYYKSDEEYALLDDLGVEWLRIDFNWSKMELREGFWDFSYYDEYLEKANAEGKKVLAILDYDTDWLHKGKDKSRRISIEELPRFLEYVEIVVKRYGDKVGAFEIWNEPNSPRFWTGSDEDFFELTRQSVEVIKGINPEILVAVGSIFYHPILGGRSFLKNMLQSGAADKADAISIHPYILTPNPEKLNVLDARALISEYGLTTPIWITEAGFPTGGMYPFKIKLEEQAEIIAQSLTILSSAGVEMITWYCLFDARNPEDIVPGMSSEAFFGIAWPDLRPKPGALAFGLIANALKNATYIPEDYEFSGKNVSSLYQSRFKMENGGEALILWSRGSTVELDLNILSEIEEIKSLITGEIFTLNKNGYVSVTKDPILITIR